MNANAEKWVAALESGEYDQTAGRLRNGDSFCCLGVACELAVKDGVIPPPVVDGEYFAYGERREIGVLPDEVRWWLHLRTQTGDYGECGESCGRDGTVVRAEL